MGINAELFILLRMLRTSFSRKEVKKGWTTSHAVYRMIPFTTFPICLQKWWSWGRYHGRCNDRERVFMFHNGKVSCTVVSNSLQFHALQPVWLLCPWNSSGKSTSVGCHFLLHGTFLTQRSNPGVLHCRKILHQLSHCYC